MSEAIETLRTATMYSNGSIAMSDRWADDIVAAYDNLEAVAEKLAEALAGIQYGYLTNHLRFACPKCRVIDSHEQGCSVGKALASWKEWKGE